MNKKILLISIFFVAVFGIVALIFGSDKKKDNVKIETSRNQKLKVAVTIFPLYDIVKNVVGDRGEVNLILPPGTSPHFFEFTPRQIGQIKKNNLAFGIGLGLDDWATTILKNNGIQTITVEKNIDLLKSGEAKNPHYWLSPQNVEIITETVANVLSAVNPEDKEVYQENARKYIGELGKKESEWQEMLEKVKCKEIITTHNAWPYFAEYFGLKIVAVFNPENGNNPSPKQLKRLSEKIKKSCAKTIFTEKQISGEIVKTFAKDNQLKIGVLDPLGGTEGANTYIKLMDYNIKEIIKGLKND